MKKNLSYFVLSLFFLSATAHATVLFDNGTTINPSNTTWNQTYSVHTVFDDFMLTGSSTITDINFSLFAVSAANYIETYVSILDGGIGGTTIVAPVASTGVLSANGLTTSNSNVPNGFDVTLSGLSINLAAGTYALGLSTKMAPNFLTSIASGDSGFGSALELLGVVRTGDHMAFSLENNASDSVPAPATLALFGLGLAAIGFRRRKQSKAA